MDRDTILGVLADARVTPFRQDSTLRYEFIGGRPAGWRDVDAPGRTDADLLPAEAAATVTAAKQDALASGRARWAEFTVDDDGTVRAFDVFVRPEHDAAGAVTGLAGIAIDRTDRRRRSTALEAIARELSHHSKNLLAIVQSLATHTALASASTEEFVERFRGRIQALALSEDFPSGPRGPGRSLADLVGAQVGPCVPVPDQVAFSGDDVLLSPNATLHVGLALHELCAASTRGGGLARPDGAAEVCIEPADDGGIRLVWREATGAPPEFERFARVLLERIVPAAVGGAAVIEPDGDGWRYSLAISAEELDLAR